MWRKSENSATRLAKILRCAQMESGTGFPACDPAQPQSGMPVLRFTLPSNLPRSTSIAPVIRSTVSMVGSRSRFSTRETIVWLNPKTAEEASKSRESPRMGRASGRRRQASFCPVTCSYLPHFIRVHWRYSRAKSGSEFNESFCRSRSSRSNSINRPITASRSDAFDTPASYATGSLTGDATIGTSKCALRTGI